MILTADLHFTDNTRDEYRWGLFPWLREQVTDLNAKQVALLGDITDQKDRHSATLVNRLVNEVRQLAELCDVLILCGNHDGVDLRNPFLAFLESFKSNITFIYKITSYWLRLGDTAVHCLFLPCTRDWRTDWVGIDFNKYDYVFTHATYDGAKSETGIELEGVAPSLFKDYKGKVYSGDIHVPQKIGRNIEYVGSPYRCRFGDNYTPRVVFLDRHRHPHDLSYPCISKHTVTIVTMSDLDDEADRLKIKAKDQVKVKVKLPRSRFPEWDKMKDEIKHYAEQHGWELFGPELHQLEDRSIKRLEMTPYKTPDNIITAYGQANKLTQRQVGIGLSIVKEL